MSEMNLNLIPSKAKFQASRIKLQKKVNLVMMVVLGGWLLAGAGIILADGILMHQVTVAQTELTKVQNNYNSLQDNIITSQKLKYRAKMVGGVLKNRFEYGTSFETVNQLFPPSISLRNYDLMDGGSFQIQGETFGQTNVDLFEQTVAAINQGENDKLKSAKITSLSMTNGLWLFTMEVTLK